MNTMKTTIKKAMRFLPALFLVVLAGNTAPTCGGNDDEQACIVATQCEGLPHADCVGQWACDTGECSFVCETDPQPVYCMSTEDCGDNEYCTTEDDECLSPPGCDEEGISCPAVCFGLCEEKVDPEWDCQVDADCGAGEVCDIQDCIAPDCAPNEPCPATCMPVGQCVTDTQPEMCTSTSQCGEGQHCSVEDGDCMADPDCEPGMGCLAVCFGQCVANVVPPESECNVDGDCDNGEVCEVVDCWSPPCNDGAPCLDMCMLIGKCVAAEPIECTDNSDCPAGMLCQEEFFCPDCVNADPPCMAPCMAMMICKEQVTPTICDADSDCPAGQHCEYQAYPYDCDADGTDCIFEGAESAGVCVPDTTPNGCQSDSDCSVGSHCELYEMCTNCYDSGENCVGACEVVGECVTDTIPGECTSDAQCAPGSHCEIFEACADCAYGEGVDCFAPCESWGECVTDSNSGECLVDSDCGPASSANCTPSATTCPAPTGTTATGDVLMKATVSPPTPTPAKLTQTAPMASTAN